jgi:hypothetical protein
MSRSRRCELLARTARRKRSDHVRCEDMKDQIEKARFARQVNQDASPYLLLPTHGDTAQSYLSRRTGCSNRSPCW